MFPAITEPGGWKGCRDSHLAVLEKYKLERFIIILEDDVVFLEDPMFPIAEVIKELPSSWDMLYLGISPQEKYERYSPHLFKVGDGYTTHAIMWHNKKNGVVDYIMSHKQEILKWDVYLNVVHKIFNCFVIYPLLCTQRQEKSDTCQRSDASSIIRNYNKYCR